MRFASDSFAVGVYEFQSVIGNGQSSRSPLGLPSVFPGVETFYQVVAKPRRFNTLRVMLSFQLGQEVPDGLVLQAHVYRRGALVEQKLVASSDDAPLELLAVVVLHIDANLSVWEDVDTQRRHVWRVTRTQEIDLRVEAGDRLLAALSHENVTLASCSAQIVLSA